MLLVLPVVLAMAGLTHVGLHVYSGELVYLFIAIAYVTLALGGFAAVVKAR